MDPTAREQWPKIRDAVNLGGIGAVVCTSGFEGKDWAGQVFVGINGPHTGILSMLGTDTVGDDQLKVVPASRPLDGRRTDESQRIDDRDSFGD